MSYIIKNRIIQSNNPRILRNNLINKETYKGYNKIILEQICKIKKNSRKWSIKRLQSYIDIVRIWNISWGFKNYNIKSNRYIIVL